MLNIIMLFMLTEGMESVSEFNQEIKEIQNNTEASNNADYRESSIESFHTNKSETSITTETELIDVDDIELSDEESWLYKSPKKIPSETCVNKCVQKNIEDMDEEELKNTRTALLNKLDNLKLLADNSCRVSASALEKCSAVTVENISSLNKPRTKYDIECQDKKNSHVLDVVDVQKIAKLQEERRRTPSSRDISPVSPAQGTSLNKPASVEALNTFTEKSNLSNEYFVIPLEGMKKKTIFHSSSSINYNPECHHGSLPNIHKGYNSLKGRKSKRTSEPKVSCPLPIYPTHTKVIANGNNSLTCDFQKKLLSPSYDQRETRTLPSSYRIHSNRNSSSRRDLGSPRRESMPYLGNNISSEPNHRENRRKFSSPISTTYPRYSLSPVTVSPTKAFNIQSQNFRSPSNMEYHRAASHSPSRRLPLSVVQHQSPKKGNNLASLKNGEVATLPSKVQSKIPNPALRSGIPVPSTCASRANDDDTWSQDCF